MLSCVVCSLSLSLLFRSLSFLLSLVVSSRFSIYVSLSSSRFSLYHPLSLLSPTTLFYPSLSLISLFTLFFMFTITSLLSFHVDAKCETVRIIHPLWDGACLRRTDTILSECEHPHCPSICWYNTASFAMVSRGPDMTSLLLIRMSYLSYTLLCTYNSSGMHETSLDTSIR